MLDIRNAPYLFTCYPSPNPSPGPAFQTIAGGGVHVPSLNLFIVRACATQFVKNIGVFDSPRVRFRILSSSSGTSPASPASSASAPAKDADDASDAGDVAHAGEGNEGGKGERISTAKGGGERSQGGKGEDLGKKCLKGERGERISNGKDLREEREKIWGTNALRVLRSFPPFPLRPLQIFSLFLPKIVSRLSLLRSFPPFPPSGKEKDPMEKKAVGGEVGEREEKGEDLTGEKALGGKGGKDLNRERGENILGRKRETSEGEKALGRKKGMDLNKERGGKNLRGEGGKGTIPKGRK